jgi:hypothetical protein
MSSFATIRALVLVVAAAGLSAGCKHERSQRVAASYSSVTKPTFHPVPKLEPEKVAVGSDGIPTEEDYEERAAATINAANLAAQLADFEKEMPF